jgi:hypothetical protein
LIVSPCYLQYKALRTTGQGISFYVGRYRYLPTLPLLRAAPDRTRPRTVARACARCARSRPVPHGSAAAASGAHYAVVIRPAPFSLARTAQTGAEFSARAYRREVDALPGSFACRAVVTLHSRLTRARLARLRLIAHSLPFPNTARGACVAPSRCPASNATAQSNRAMAHATTIQTSARVTLCPFPLDLTPDRSAAVARAKLSAPLLPQCTTPVWPLASERFLRYA